MTNIYQRLATLEGRLNSNERVLLTFADGSKQSMPGSIQTWHTLLDASRRRDAAKRAGDALPDDPASRMLVSLCSAVKVTEYAQMFALIRAMEAGPVQ